MCPCGPISVNHNIFLWLRICSLAAACSYCHCRLVGCSAVQTPIKKERGRWAEETLRSRFRRSFSLGHLTHQTTAGNRRCSQSYHGVVRSHWFPFPPTTAANQLFQACADTTPRFDPPHQWQDFPRISSCNKLWPFPPRHCTATAHPEDVEIYPQRDTPVPAGKPDFCRSEMHPARSIPPDWSPCSSALASHHTEKPRWDHLPSNTALNSLKITTLSRVYFLRFCHHSYQLLWSQ